MADGAILSAPLSGAAADLSKPSQGYWRLVWLQFRKNRIALTSAGVIAFLFWLAAWAPVLANGLPWVWRENGATSYPLCQWLAAPSDTLSVDYLFNYFFFFSLALPLVGLPVWWRSRRRQLSARTRRRRAAAAMAAAALLAFTPFLAPGTYERSAKPEERTASGAQKVAVPHLLRRHRLDRRYYLMRQYALDPAQGDYALFPFIAQDPIKPMREVLHPMGAYVVFNERKYRLMTPAVLTTPNLGGIRRVSFDGDYAGRDGETLKLAGVEGRLRCADPEVLKTLDRAGPGPVWLCGKHTTQMNDAGEVTAIEVLVEGAGRAPASLPRVTHWLGTDSQGRDVLARLIHGARISISVGFVAVALATILGIVVGGLAGYYRGWLDIAISRLIELVICFPTFFLIITIIAFIEERSIFHVMLVMGLTGWPGVARLVRGEFLKLAEQDFVHAGRALGCSGVRLMFRHILPNALGPVLVTVAFAVAGAVLTESGLAFLGFGAPPPTPTWGEMISQGHQQIASGAWWLFFFPGFLIFLTVTVYNLAGDGLRDAMDPRLRK